MSGEHIEGSQPEDGQVKPDETQYDLMEIAAAAGGPEAEARRNEMNKWSEAAGAHAEAAARNTNEAGDEAVQQGRSADQVASAMGYASHISATEGEFIPGADGKPETLVRPTEGGMEVKSPLSNPQEYRSPAQIARDEAAKRGETPSETEQAA